MARPLRIEFPGALYHITSRGNARQDIFLHEKDYRTFLEVLCEVVEDFKWILHAYCLMPNHYHLLVETPEANLSRGMRQLNGVYTQKFNFRYHRVGHLFQGRYKAILVNKDQYLLELSRYIVLNPVRAGLIKRPEEWPWSSFSAILGKIKAPRCLSTEWILSQFSSVKKEAIKRFCNFVYDGIGKESPLQKVSGQIFLGDENFIQRVQAFASEKSSVKEFPKSQRLPLKPRLEELFKDRKNKDLVEKAIFEAYIKYGFTLREISDYLGMHYSTVSKVIKRMKLKERGREGS